MPFDTIDITGTLTLSSTDESSGDEPAVQMLLLSFDDTNSTVIPTFRSSGALGDDLPAGSTRTVTFNFNVMPGAQNPFVAIVVRTLECDNSLDRSRDTNDTAFTTACVSALTALDPPSRSSQFTVQDTLITAGLAAPNNR